MAGREAVAFAVDPATEERSLRTFLALLERTPGEGIARVEREVSPVHELAAVVKCLEGTDHRPVLFEHVSGHDLPVLMNVYGSKRRIALAMGLPPDIHPEEVMSHYLECLQQRVRPSRVSNGPVKEVIQLDENASLDLLPIGVHPAQQGGRYINSAVLLVRDPDSKAINAGVYRIMVHGPRRVTVSVDPGHDLGKVIDWGRAHDKAVAFAMVVGADPALALASQAKVPISHDSYDLMGALAGESVRVVRCETSDLLVPATAEIVIEGQIMPRVTAAEGPYGEFSYYYGSDPAATVCTVTAISRRQNALFQDIHPTHVEHRCLWLHPGREASLLQRLRSVVPTVRSVHIPLEGAAMVAVISIDKVHEGDPKRALLVALSSDVFIKHAVVVDSDIDIHHAGRVLWALATRFQADRDTVIVPGVRGYSEDPSGYGCDPTKPGGGLTTKIGYDATAALQGFPEPADLIPEPYRDLDPHAYVVNAQP
ncbi:MAG: UbiD family decarboxylase [Solirubrobacteraceae bacterium]